MKTAALLLAFLFPVSAQTNERLVKKLFKPRRPATSPFRLGDAGAAGIGAARWAAYLNRTGQFYHARSGYRAEVLYRSSGTATRAAALRAWRRSPPHRRLLPQIRAIRCVGRVCVGRG